jgi:hypothetical protein
MLRGEEPAGGDAKGRGWQVEPGPGAEMARPSDVLRRGNNAKAMLSAALSFSSGPRKKISCFAVKIGVTSRAISFCPGG